MKVTITRFLLILVRYGDYSASQHSSFGMLAASLSQMRPNSQFSRLQTIFQEHVMFYPCALSSVSRRQLTRVLHSMVYSECLSDPKIPLL